MNAFYDDESVLKRAGGRPKGFDDLKKRGGGHLRTFYRDEPAVKRGGGHRMSYDDLVKRGGARAQAFDDWMDGTKRGGGRPMTLETWKRGGARAMDFADWSKRSYPMYLKAMRKWAKERELLRKIQRSPFIFEEDF